MIQKNRDLIFDCDVNLDKDQSICHDYKVASVKFGFGWDSNSSSHYRIAGANRRFKFQPTQFLVTLHNGSGG